MNTIDQYIAENGLVADDLCQSLLDLLYWTGKAHSSTLSEADDVVDVCKKVLHHVCELVVYFDLNTSLVLPEDSVDVVYQMQVESAADIMITEFPDIIKTATKEDFNSEDRISLSLNMMIIVSSISVILNAKQTTIKELLIN